MTFCADLLMDAVLSSLTAKRVMSQSEMAQEWLEDLAKRAERREDHFYRLARTTEKLAEGIELRREGL